jgi:hypothetical protein
MDPYPSAASTATIERVANAATRQHLAVAAKIASLDPHAPSGTGTAKCRRVFAVAAIDTELAVQQKVRRCLDTERRSSITGRVQAVVDHV